MVEEKLEIAEGGSPESEGRHGTRFGTTPARHLSRLCNVSRYVPEPATNIGHTWYISLRGGFQDREDEQNQH